MLPCPAPRRLAARPAGRLRSRSARSRASRAGGSAAWLAKTGSRSHSSTKALDPVALEPIGASLVGGAAGRAFGGVRDARGRTFEDEPADDGRVRDGQPQGDPRAERVAEDVRRRDAERVQGSSRGRPPTARRSLGSGRSGCRIGRGPGRSTTTTRNGAAKAVACAPQLDPRPVNPWSSSSGTPVPRTRTSQRRPSTLDAAHRRRQGVGDDGGRLAMQLDVARRDPCGSARTRTPGWPIEVGQRRAEVGRVRPSELAAERRHDRPDVDAVGRPEQLLVVRRAGPTSGASVVACGRNEKIPPPSLSMSTIVADRSWSRAATSALRSCRNETSPTTSATGPTLGRRRAERGRDDAVDAVGAAVRQRPDGPIGAGQPVVEVADRHAVAGPQQRAVGQDARRAPRTAGPRTPRRAPSTPASQPSRVRGRRPGRPRTRRVPSRSIRAARSASSSSASGVGGGGRVGVDEGRREDRRVAPAAVAVDDDLGGHRVVEQGQHRLRGRASPRTGRRGRAGGRRATVPAGRGGRRGTGRAPRSCGPQRTPESGSATIGKPVAAARRARAAGQGRVVLRVRRR